MNFERQQLCIKFQRNSDVLIEHIHLFLVAIIWFCGAVSFSFWHITRHSDEQRFLGWFL